MSIRERGFTLLTTGVSVFVMIGMLGLAVDLGRMYIVKNEAQTYTDSAALAAVRELDGTMSGISRAAHAVAANGNKFNLNTTGFTGSRTEFATAQNGPWASNPASAAGIRYTRVTASGRIPLLFLTAVVSQDAAVVWAASIAGQQPKMTWREGLFPFSPFAHNTTPPHFGLIPGQVYTLRWASNPKLDQNTCPGDNTTQMINIAQGGGGEERGFIEDTAASIVRQAIVYDFQTVFRTIGDSVNMTGGAKQTERDAIIERINQDTDTSSNTMEGYHGNTRRLIGVPINAGFPSYEIVQIGGYLLLPSSDYSSGGNQPFCAIYTGPYVEGSTHPGGGGASGGYVVRLVQ